MNEQTLIEFRDVMNQNLITRAEAVNAFANLRAQAAEVPEMSIEEINTEISNSRLEGKI